MNAIQATNGKNAMDIPLLHEGRMLLLSGKYGQAFTRFDKGIKGVTENPENPENPENHLLYDHRGIANFKMTKYKEALKDFNKAIALVQKENTARGQGNAYASAVKFLRRGMASIEKKAFCRAVQDFNLCLKIKPSFVNAYLERGKAFYRMEAYDCTVKDCSEAIEAGGTDTMKAKAHLLRGLAYMALGQHDKGMEDYHLSMGLDKSVPPDMVSLEFGGADV